MKKTCDNCNGEGYFQVTSCCGAKPVGNGDSDTSDIGICPECGDHDDYHCECEECSGTGEIEAE